jgi:hypothetical protein
MLAAISGSSLDMSESFDKMYGRTSAFDGALPCISSPIINPIGQPS